MRDEGRQERVFASMRTFDAEARRLVRPVFVFGISVYVVFTVVALQYPTLRPPDAGSATILEMSVLGLANALTFLAVALLFLWKRIVIGGRFYLPVVGGALVAGIAVGQAAVMVLEGGSPGFAAASIAADVLVGSATACLGIEWVRVLSAVASRQAAANVVAAVVVSVPLLLVAGLVGPQIGPLGLVLAGACLALLWRCAPERARMAKSGLKSSIRMPWKLIVTIALQGMSTGVVHSAVVSYQSGAFLPVEALGFACAGAIAVVGLFAFRLDFNHLLYMIGFPLMACGQMVIALLGPDLVGVAVHEAGYRFVMILSWVLAAWVIKHNDLSANWVWPCFMCSFVFGRIAGSSLGAIAEDLLPAFADAGFSIVLVFVLMLGALLLFGSVDLKTGWDMASVEPAPEDGASRSVFDRACEVLACDYRLTPREAEVFGQLARGRNQEYISDRLHVSKDTVKTHRKSVYRKLDIHSQQDLVSLVEQAVEMLDEAGKDRAAPTRVVL